VQLLRDQVAPLGLHMDHASVTLNRSFSKVALLLTRHTRPLLRWLKACREPICTPYRARAIRPRSLVSLVSAWGRNWCYLCGTVEGVEMDETVEIANIHAVFLHVAENMVR
jgi:hypothetical protein